MSQPDLLTPGSWFTDRFQIERQVGAGGMGTVFCALDVLTNRRVALKVLQTNGVPFEGERFAREAQLLAELSHPHIVSYVADGAEQGQHFLAMEWLDGEDLAQRLHREPLSLSETVALLTNASSALAAAHKSGIVHRDLKPSNLFLRKRSAGDVVLLDFGIARRTLVGGAITRTGALIGTPGYMAPEQARGERSIGPAADIFSLGCVVYECLAGRAPFVGEHVASVLIKILFENPPPLEGLRGGIPESLSQLIAKMLSKDPRERHANGAALYQAVSALELPAGGLADSIASQTLATYARPEEEQHVFSLALAVPRGVTGAGEDDGAQLQEQLASLESLKQALRRLGATVEVLADGSIVATTLTATTAIDQALIAARCGLLMEGRLPDCELVVATGKGQLRGHTPMGEVVERALGLLAERAQAVALAEAPPTGVLLDELSANLLAGRFEMLQSHGLTRLGREYVSDAREDARKLLGKPTPCVGREQELSTLEASLRTCLEDGQAAAVLVTAAPGMGKSRLRFEFLKRARSLDDGMLVLFGRSELMGSGTPYGLLRQALCTLCGVVEGEPAERQQHRLEARVGQHLQGEVRQWVAEFLGELCAIPFSSAGRVQLQKARQDPRLMGEQVSQALVEFLRAEASAHPVMLVLEDIHWADSLSIKLVERALRELESQPIFVLSLARPEVRDVFPELWGGKALEIPLRSLTRRACERLVLEILGRNTPPERVAQVVQQAAGNALFLEELIRATAEGKGDALPDTVLAMLQSRISGLGFEVRRVLRAGSIFGETFWRGAVAALLGSSQPSGGVDSCLAELTRVEILERRRDSRYPGEEEYAFRHALVREAAYGLLTEDERRSWHLSAARYLESAGESEPMVLVEHYRRAELPARTVPLYMRAGQEANRIGGLPEARRLYAAAYSVLGRLTDTPEHRRFRVDVLLQQTQIGMMADTPAQNLSRMDEARTLLTSLAESSPADSEDTRRLARVDFLCARILHYLGQASESLEYCERVMPLAAALKDERLTAMTTQAVGTVLLMQGLAGRCRPLLGRGAALEERVDSDYERLRVLGNYAMSLVMSGEYTQGMALHQQAVARAYESKHASGLSVALSMRTFSERVAGDFQALRKSARLALEQTLRSGERLLQYMMLSLLGWAEGWLGNQREGVALRNEAKQLAAGLGTGIFYSDWFTAADAEIALRAGDLATAQALASELVPHCRRAGLTLGLGLAEQIWGLALGFGEPSRSEEADAHLAAGLAVMLEAEQHLAAALLRFEWAHLCHRRGDGERAASLRGEATARFAAAGCLHIVPQLEGAQR